MTQAAKFLRHVQWGERLTEQRLLDKAQQDAPKEKGSAAWARFLDCTAQLLHEQEMAAYQLGKAGATI